MSRELSPDRWALVQERLHECLALDPAAREEALASLAERDAPLADEVRSLLRAEEGGALGRSLDEPRTPPMPARIGPYRLIRRLGEGGMGTVFLAERAESGFVQRVALKLVRAGLLDPRLGAHAEHERRVLARLEHPNIARLIDGGTTPEGQPYLAMEYVEGRTLLEHAAAHALPIADRVRLLIEICDAVHHAHQQLVIHRDLKPSNVMVGDDGRPRLLDFGIAKLVEADEPGSGLSQSAPWLTPSYASPEQVRREPIGTYSDVYSLGVLAYELLAGERPYRLEGRAPAECARIICEEDPRRPSVAAADSATRVALRGDLDTIVLKALAKQPSHRYASSAELADDLHRFLDGRPIAARAAGLGYRLGKFVRRNRTVAALSAVAALLFVGGIVGVARQAQVARRERDRAEEARQVAEQVTAYLTGLFDADGAVTGLGDTTVARALLEEGIRQAETLAAQPLLQARMYDALGMVFLRMQRAVDAARLVERGRTERAQRLPAGHPDLAESDAHLSRVRRAQSRYPEAESLAQRALVARVAAFGRWHPSVAESHRDLAQLMPFLGHDSASVSHAEAALAIHRRVNGEEDPQTMDSRVLLARTLQRRGEYARGLATLDTALAAQVALFGPDHPRLSSTRFSIADLLRNLGRIQEAEMTYRDALARHRRGAGSDDLGAMHGLGNLADLLGEQGREAEAEPLLREAIALQAARFGERSVGYAEATDALASSLARQGRIDEALRLRRRSLAIWRLTLGDEHVAVAGSLGALSALLLRSGRADDAEGPAREAVAMRIRLLGEPHALVALSRMQLARVLLGRGRPIAAETEARRALGILDASRPTGHPDLREAHRVVAEVMEALGRRAEAARHRAAAGM